jgi:hypothetical protein
MDPPAARNPSSETAHALHSRSSGVIATFLCMQMYPKGGRESNPIIRSSVCSETVVCAEARNHLAANGSIGCGARSGCCARTTTGLLLDIPCGRPLRLRSPPPALSCFGLGLDVCARRGVEEKCIVCRLYMWVWRVMMEFLPDLYIYISPSSFVILCIVAYMKSA